ncbi:MAG: hypothetical protein JWO78_2389 [Micavibrio sp.]|nr:hypothetical protein [Micavibrio sp.]
MKRFQYISAEDKGMTAIYTPIVECPEVVIVPERDLFYTFNRSRFDTAVLYRRPISGRFSQLASFLYDRETELQTEKGLKAFTLNDLKQYRGHEDFADELTVRTGPCAPLRMLMVG